VAAPAAAAGLVVAATAALLRGRRPPLSVAAPATAQVSTPWLQTHRA
jgi:hypothetical protein